MKFTSMSSRDRRALMIGALIAIPGLAGPLAVKPYWHALSAIREATSVERDRLERERRAIAALPGFPAARARASRQLDNELNRLFQSSNELVSTGDLAQYVAQAAQDNGVSLQQSETRPARTVVPGVQALQVEIHAAGDLDGILHFVHQLESGGKLVRFGVLSIDGGRGPLDAPMNTITSPIRPSAAAAAAGASVPESGSGAGANSSSTSATGGVVANVGIDNGVSVNRVVIGGNGDFFSGGLSGSLSAAFSGTSSQDTPSLPRPVFTARPRRSFSIARKSGPDLNQAKGSAVEVLSLSASVYGYRLSGTQWSSVNTHDKTAPSPFSREPYAFESLDAVVDHDPFSATRTRPLPSYRLTMTQPAQPPPSQDSANIVRQRQQERQRFQQQLHLLGTVLSSGHTSFVMCQSGNAPSRVVHIGEQIDGYTLASLDRGTAVFVSPSGERVNLHTANPGDDVTPTAAERAFMEQLQQKTGDKGGFDRLPTGMRAEVLRKIREKMLEAVKSGQVSPSQAGPSK
jgi:hypothetical protein